MHGLGFLAADIDQDQASILERLRELLRRSWCGLPCEADFARRLVRAA